MFKIGEQSQFSLDKFISHEDIAFYRNFPSYAAFVATYTLGGGPGRPRILNSDVQAKAGFS